MHTSFSTQGQGMTFLEFRMPYLMNLKYLFLAMANAVGSLQFMYQKANHLVPEVKDTTLKKRCNRINSFVEKIQTKKKDNKITHCQYSQLNIQ